MIRTETTQGDTPSHWVVVALFTEPDSDAPTVDEEWHVFETYDGALTAYDSVVEAGAYSASLCAVVLSTDYDPHPVFARCL